MCCCNQSNCNSCSGSRSGCGCSNSNRGIAVPASSLYVYIPGSVIDRNIASAESYCNGCSANNGYADYTCRGCCTCY